MAFVYYCKSCKSTFSADEDNTYQNCPKCNVKMLATHMIVDQWKTKTEEEKQELRKKFDELEIQGNYNSSENANSIGKVLEVVGWIYIVLSIIGAFVLASETEVAIGFVAGLFGCLGGLLLLAFGEVVNLLQDIKNK